MIDDGVGIPLRYVESKICQEKIKYFFPITLLFMINCAKRKVLYLYWDVYNYFYLIFPTHARPSHELAISKKKLFTHLILRWT